MSVERIEIAAGVRRRLETRRGNTIGLLRDVNVNLQRSPVRKFSASVSSAVATFQRSESDTGIDSENARVQPSSVVPLRIVLSSAYTALARTTKSRAIEP